MRGERGADSQPDDSAGPEVGSLRSARSAALAAQDGREKDPLAMARAPSRTGKPPPIRSAAIALAQKTRGLTAPLMP